MPTLDNVSTGTDATGGGLSVSHETGDNPNRYMLVAITMRESDTVSSVEYDGNPLRFLTNTPAGGGNSGRRLWLYDLVAPPVGTADVVLVTSDTGNCAVTIRTFYDVHQDVPLRNMDVESQESGTSISLSVPAKDGDLVVDALSLRSTTAPSADSGQSEDSVVLAGTVVYNATSRKAVTADGNVSMGWSWSSSDVNVLGVVVLQPADAYDGDPVAFEAGSFVKDDSGTDGVLQRVTHGLGTIPKAITFWATGKQDVDGWRGSYFGSLGFVGQDLQGYVVGFENFNNSNHEGRSYRANAISIGRNLATTLVRGQVVAADDSSFTVRWDVNTDRDQIITFQVIGGDGVEAKAFNWEAPTETGNHSETGIGFMPDVVLFANAELVAFGSQATAHVGLGAFDGSDEWAMALRAFSSEFSASEFAVQRQVMNSCHVAMAASTGASNSRASGVSLDEDGFTLNFSVADDAILVATLAIRGIEARVGAFDKATGSAPATNIVDNLGFDPGALMLASHMRPADGAPQTHGRIGIGFSDGSTEVASGLTNEQTGGDPEANTSAWATRTEAFWKTDNDAQQVEAEGTVALGTDQFSVTWDPNDAVATQILYLALGAPAVETIDIDLEPVEVEVELPPWEVSIAEPPPEPISIDLEPVEVEVELPAWTVTGAPIVIDLEPVEVEVDLPAWGVERTIGLAPVEIEVELPAWTVTQFSEELHGAAGIIVHRPDGSAVEGLAGPIQRLTMWKMRRGLNQAGDWEAEFPVDQQVIDDVPLARSIQRGWRVSLIQEHSLPDDRLDLEELLYQGIVEDKRFEIGEDGSTLCRLSGSMSGLRLAARSTPVSATYNNQTIASIVTDIIGDVLEAPILPANTSRRMSVAFGNDGGDGILSRYARLLRVAEYGRYTVRESWERDRLELVDIDAPPWSGYTIINQESAGPDQRRAAEHGFALVSGTPTIERQGGGLVNRIIPFGSDTVSDGEGGTTDAPLTLEHATRTSPYEPQQVGGAWVLQDDASIERHGLVEQAIHRTDVKNPSDDEGTRTASANVLHAVVSGELIKHAHVKNEIKMAIANGAHVWALPGDRIRVQFVGLMKTADGDLLWEDFGAKGQWFLVTERSDQMTAPGVRDVTFTLAAPDPELRIPGLPDPVDEDEDMPLLPHTDSPVPPGSPTPGGGGGFGGGGTPGAGGGDAFPDCCPDDTTSVTDIDDDVGPPEIEADSDAPEPKWHRLEFVDGEGDEWNSELPAGLINRVVLLSIRRSRSPAPAAGVTSVGGDLAWSAITDVSVDGSVSGATHFWYWAFQSSGDAARVEIVAPDQGGTSVEVAAIEFPGIDSTSPVVQFDTETKATPGGEITLSLDAFTDDAEAVLIVGRADADVEQEHLPPMEMPDGQAAIAGHYFSGTWWYAGSKEEMRFIVGAVLNTTAISLELRGG